MATTTGLSGAEEEVAKQFLKEINSHRKKENKSPISWKDAVKFCMARKFDKDRAYSLYLNHEEVRSKERLDNVNPFVADVRSELLSGKLTILDSTDSSGAAIALFTARFHNQLTVPRVTTLQSLVIQLDAALDSLDAQRNGLVFVYDMTDSRFVNFDYDLSIKILELLKGSFPARLKKVLIVLAPLWFKAPFKIMRLFVREKLRDRVYTVNDEELREHIPDEALPVHLGGLLQVNHLFWLKRCLKSRQYSDTDMENFFNNAVAPNYKTAKYAQHMAQVEALRNKRVLSSHPSSNHATTNQISNPPSANHSSSSHLPPHSQVNNRASQHPVPPPGSPSLPPPPPPTSRPPPPVPVRNFGDGSLPPGIAPRWDVTSSDMLVPKVAYMGPSCEDSDPHQSVFPDAIRDLLQPAKQLDDAVSLGKDGLVSQYLRIKNEPLTDTFNVSKSPMNNGKNRYSDVLCYDFTRVVLENRPPGMDYINANHVNSFRQKRGYICCQGPLPKTFVDFWFMVWQEKARTIVMTTKLMEKGRTKCGTYWPQSVNEMETYGDINVMNMEVELDTSEDFQITTLCLSDRKTGETRFIKHMLFLKWPDYGIPPSADAFLHFIKSVREIQAESVDDMPEWQGHPRGPPIVVHCSAGIGRTGTFICSDICMYMLDSIGTVNIKNVVRLIRSQRAFAVQMPDQYVFCHIAILQYAQQRGLLPADIDIPTMFEDAF